MDSQPTRPDRREPLGETITRVNIHKPIIHKPVDNSAARRQSVDLHAALPPIPRGEENDAYPYHSNRNSQIQPVSDEPSASSKRFSQISTTSNTSSVSRRKTHVGPWRLGRTLGRGASGRVRLAKHSQTGQYAAVKIVAKNAAALVQSKSMAFAAEVLEGDSKDKKLPLGIEREVVIMKLIDHPNVMRLYDVWENRGELYIVLEYIEGGELFTYLSKRGRLPENEAIHYFRQIISGLSYCHKFGICHRDLKPENLLLDASQSTIKIADFGMAALQPRGSMLHTSCGSPHYAAPEIIRGQPYKGEKCDIWSCGIILFALLAGYLPFDDEDIRILLKKVKIGRFEMPEPFSIEAKDLIDRMLKQDPNRRITMDEIWDHPLLKKYENKGPAAGGQLSPEKGTGAQPHLGVDNVGRPVKKRSDIDAEILRNLQTLWYSETKETIVQRLMSEEENDEKVFYYLLLKFKESQQENYHSTDLTYSSSDKHHQRRTSIPVEPIPVPAIPVEKALPPVEKPRKLAPAREDSGLSQADTVLSYDAFRMSGGLEDLPKEGSKLALIEALRDTAALAPRMPSHSTTFRSTNRLRTRHQLDSCVSVASSVRSTRSAKRRVGTRKIGSKASFSSSLHKASSTTNRLGDSSAKGVPQTPSKPRSLASRSTHNIKKTPRFVLQNKNNATSSSLSQALAGVLQHSSSPAYDAIPLPVPRRPSTAHSGKTKSRVSYLLLEEARKVSAELEALCDEMFNRSSGISTVLTGADSGLPRITPSSSISSLSDSFFTAETVIKTADAVQMQEVMPAPPGTAIDTESPSLQDVRIRVVNRFRDASGATRSRGSSFNTGFRNVMARLDTLTQMPTNGRRAVSSPLDHRPIPVGARPLPVISEEKPSMDNTDAMQRNRVSSEPVNRRYSLFPPVDPKERGYQPTQPSRLVDIRPPNVTHIPPPLRVRKRQQAAAEEEDELPSPPVSHYQQRQLPRPPIDDMSPPEIPERRSFHPLESNPVYPSRSAATSPNFSLPSTPSPVPQSHGSYRRSTEQMRYRSSPTSGIVTPPEHDAPAPPPKDGKRLAPFVHGRRMPENRQEVVSFQDIAAQQPKRLSGVSEKWSFLKRLAKQATSRNGKGSDGDSANISLDAQSCYSGTSSDTNSSSQGGWMPPRISNDYHAPNSRFYAPPEQHWLARLFHIKPASRTVCLQIGHRRARSEMTKALRGWRKYGMLDVIEDRDAGIITGRVGEENFLSIKPVSFRIELYGVTEVGKGKNKVSIARVTQVAGAASSMNKVVDTLETVLGSKGFLVKEKKRVRAMEKLLK